MPSSSILIEDGLIENISVKTVLTVNFGEGITYQMFQTDSLNVVSKCYVGKSLK